MANFFIALIIVAPMAFIVYCMAISEVNKNKIFRDYKVLVWDEQDYIYVVEDKETKKQYILDSRLTKYKFKESDTDWSFRSDKPYIKERIFGTNRYETTK